MSNPDIIRLNHEIKEAKVQTELIKSLERLKLNPDFKRVILDGLFKDEAIRLVKAKASSEYESAESQQRIMHQIDGIGFLYGYFETIMNIGGTASASLEEKEEHLAELLREEAE